MKTQFSRVMKRCVGGAALHVAMAQVFAIIAGLGFASSTSAQVTPTYDPPAELLVGGAVLAPSVGIKGGLNLVPTTEVSMVSDYDQTGTGAGFQFRLTSYAMTGIGLNPFGSSKLTLMYELQNLSSESVTVTQLGSGNDPRIEWGITSLFVNGFAGASIYVGEGIYTSPNMGVVPGNTRRDGDPNAIEFWYPANGTPAPPIYAGQYSNQLWVFTNAENYAVGSTKIINTLAVFARDPGGADMPELSVAPVETTSVQAFTIAPSAVPDGTSTTGLLLIGSCLISFVLRRRN
jgi:hypothetical protein